MQKINEMYLGKNSQILAKKGQILAVSEYSWYQDCVFPKEDHLFSFYSEKYEN